MTEHHARVGLQRQFVRASMRRRTISIICLAAASSPTLAMFVYDSSKWTPPASRFVWLALAAAGGAVAVAAPRVPGRAGMVLYIIAGLVSVAGWSAMVSAWYGWDQYRRQIETDALLGSHAALVMAFRSKHHVLPTQSQWQWLAMQASRPLSLEDAWGNPLLYAVSAKSGETTFVLASPGRDALLDVADVTDYIGRSPRHDEYNSDRDLVNVGGERIVVAGK